MSRTFFYTKLNTNILSQIISIIKLFKNNQKYRKTNLYFPIKHHRNWNNLWIIIKKKKYDIFHFLDFVKFWKNLTKNFFHYYFRDGDRKLRRYSIEQVRITVLPCYNRRSIIYKIITVLVEFYWSDHSGIEVYG